VDVGRERSQARVAGAFGIASAAATFGSIILAARGSRVERTPGGGPRRAEQLQDLHDKADWQYAAAGVRSLGLLLAIVVGLFLYKAVRDRSAEIPAFTRLLGIIGPVLVAVATIVGLVVLKDVADTFVASGAHTEARAKHLVDADGTLKATFVLERIAYLCFGIWVTVLSLMAMRVGLLTRFLGIWGIGSGLASTLLPIGNALFIGWLASVSVIALGWWPGGRPPAWDAGRAVPWSEVEGARG
jgi:hypothetical protein